MTPDEAWKILESADLLCDEAAVRAAIARLAAEITPSLKGRYPLVLAVMGGSFFFAGHLLPRLRFPLEFDFILASRSVNTPSGAVFVWKVEPRKNLNGSSEFIPDRSRTGGL